MSNYKYRQAHSDRMFDNAERFEKKIDDPANSDDPRWLLRIANGIRQQAAAKEKALEHVKYRRRKRGRLLQK